ncbi:hypothetical protein C1637_14290 [Chryseobacterium lactis]|uniref:Transporter suffix domain-containing protein n=1 Tax=Chryseobacterium lactis TaxID=1241981 RepID=A0A3G6RPZ9_CHRLC|nr:transporter suffix domain-containing protein [Chryseobacterium lactis]AZA83709.1 transporter suffix domain-containing protein [Chryseobacterium lactis]AZB04094.1 transporter suffix domain-containing protein [Chryseobacterium lactis]PNW12998.1 hypothetical protein C1637_14290 [Chryseobacterium lactis]
MSKEKYNLKSKLEYTFLGIGTLCLVGVPILSFMDFPDKAATVLVILIIGEALFLITITLSGKDYMEKIKESLSEFFFFKRKKR